MLMNLIHNMYLEITHLKLLPPLPGDNEYTQYSIEHISIQVYTSKGEMLNIMVMLGIWYDTWLSCSLRDSLGRLRPKHAWLIIMTMLG